MNKSIIVHDLGLVEYEKALEYQLNLFNEIIESKLSNRRSNSNIITKNHLVFTSILGGQNVAISLDLAMIMEIRVFPQVRFQ